MSTIPLNLETDTIPMPPAFGIEHFPEVAHELRQLLGSEAGSPWCGSRYRDNSSPLADAAPAARRN